MPVTNTQDEWNGRRIDVRHINPSIMEGERGHTSMYGQGSAVSIVRFAPTFLINPTITGSFKIPSVLTCNPGVIEASPQATLFFQWRANGEDIVGETSRTIVTSLDFDAFTLTCEVTAVNFLGMDIAVSNGITAELIEPVINHEYFNYTVTGLNQEDHQNTMNVTALITTGISMYLREDMQQHVVLIGTGMSVQLRDDVLSQTAAILTGLGADEGFYLYDVEGYSYWQPTYVGDLPLINPGAETGDTTGWTITEGAIVSTTGSRSGTDGRPNGGRYFSAHNTTLGGTFGYIQATMQQTVDLVPADFAEIDDNRMFARYSYFFDTRSDTFEHQFRSSIQCLDEFDNVLYNENLYTPLFLPDDWREDYTELINFPPNTRKLRVIAIFRGRSAFPLEVYADDFRVQLFKDEHQA